MKPAMWKKTLVVLPLALLLGGVAQAVGPANEQRGEMLYSTHCIACHTAQVHWRDQRLATDMSTLKGQIRRWAVNTGLSWEDADVDAVADYLNRRYYDFPIEQAPRRVSRLDAR